jgi:hypothetical protein
VAQPAAGSIFACRIFSIFGDGVAEAGSIFACRIFCRIFSGWASWASPSEARKGQGERGAREARSEEGEGEARKAEEAEGRGEGEAKRAGRPNVSKKTDRSVCLDVSIKVEALTCGKGRDFVVISWG